MKTIILPTSTRNTYLQLVAGMTAAILLAFSGVFTAHAQTYSFDQALTIGSRGTAVRNLQAFLATDATIYPEGLITGYYGTLTARAVQRFQCRQGIVCSGSISTNGYGRVGPMTLAKLQVVGGLTGIGGPDVTVTGDVFAPIQSGQFISTSTPFSANISWSTTEPARSRVIYSTSFPFNYSVAPSSVDATFDANANVTLTGLVPNTTYFYVRESVDASGNVMWSAPLTFRTAP